MIGGVNEGIGSRIRRHSEHYKENRKAGIFIRVVGIMVAIMTVLPFIVR